MRAPARVLGAIGLIALPLCAARAQLLRSAEGSFARGPDVACYTFATLGGGAFLSLKGGVSL